MKFFDIFTYFFTILFSVCAVSIMTYISMATPIGPWIETTIVMLGIITFYFFKHNYAATAQSIALTTAAAGIGGILATGFGFSLPALYFTDQAFFNDLLRNPTQLLIFVSGLALSASSFGFLIADIFEKSLITEQKLPFPIGEMIYKTIYADNRLQQALELASGFLGVLFFFIVNRCGAFIQSTITLMHKIKWSFISLSEISVPLDQLPIYLSVGFVTGHIIAIPLIAGFLAKTFIIDPLHFIYSHNDIMLHKIFFPLGTSAAGTVGINLFEFTLAFCSGMVLYGTLAALLDIKFLRTIVSKCKSAVIQLYSLINQIFGTKKRNSYSGEVDDHAANDNVSNNNTSNTNDNTHSQRMSDNTLRGWSYDTSTLLKALGVLTITLSYFWYCQFSFLTQFYILLFTGYCVYQMLIIAGRIGIVPLGRFATFVMVPGLLLFGLSSIQALVIATFVEVAGGVGADVLFGRKLAQLSNIPSSSIQKHQLAGLLVSCIAISFFFWLFATTIGFGPQGLPVVKAASRAILLNITSFDFYVLALGLIFGYLLTFTRINSALLLGGILMPPSISLMLIAGGLLSFIAKNKERYYPLCSGISAGSVIWILIQAVCSISR